MQNIFKVLWVDKQAGITAHTVMGKSPSPVKYVVKQDKNIESGVFQNPL